jgi:hypothetical protein
MTKQASLPALSAWLFGFVPATSACFLKWIFAAAINYYQY